ncbi:FIST signal transduction protein [Chitinophaga sancti]|uniref:FIST signal transduction protein n=1 Tax=Chitinophaga sancti TaxID=1004 RepID=UPI003F78E52A
MKTALYQCKSMNDDIVTVKTGAEENNACLVLCFAGHRRLDEEDWYTRLKDKFPIADIVICSTAGEICNTTVTEEGVSFISIEMKKTRIATGKVNISNYKGSYEAGKALIESLDKKDLRYVLVISDGELVNGSKLVQGMNDGAGSILITGGLAGDGNQFQSTLVGINGKPEKGVIACIGFYGDHLLVGHGSQGGWETFGLEKKVTKSSVNVLYEINDKNALDIYKHYLGPDATALPWAALLYPLSVKLPGTGEVVVRTILSIDEKAGSMRFAGDIPEGALVRFMHANFDRLTNAAAGAAVQSVVKNGIPPDFALLISCVGRKLILQSRVEDEIEVVDEVFNHQTPIVGFYSYGELSPLFPGGACQLQNQTMTITTFYEME